jgi:Wzt C-terminal domain/Sulfotransferase family
VRVCFFHVPKAGGTSITSLMRAHFGAENVFQIKDRFCAVPIARLMRARSIIAGHLSVYYLSDEVLKDTFVFTFLRDPVERVLSQYSYYRGLPEGNPNLDVEHAQTLELKELFKRYAISAEFSSWSNLQTQLFSGCDYYRPPTAETLDHAKHNLKQFAFVGVQEDLAAGAAALLDAWEANATLELPQLNRSEHRILADAIDDETRALIEENNAFDLELHAHAADLWRKRHRPPASPKLIFDLVDTTNYGTREIEIVSVAIKGDTEARRQIVRDRPWALLIKMRSSIVEHNLTVGIKISDEIGMTLYGTNSYLKGQKLPGIVGEFAVEIGFPRVALAPGRYVLTAALHTGHASGEKCFHWIENALEFEVVPPEAGDFIGMVDRSGRVSKSVAIGLTSLNWRHDRNLIAAIHDVVAPDELNAGCHQNAPIPIPERGRLGINFLEQTGGGRSFRDFQVDLGLSGQIAQPREELDANLHSKIQVLAWTNSFRRTPMHGRFR